MFGSYNSQICMDETIEATLNSTSSRDGCVLQGIVFLSEPQLTTKIQRGRTSTPTAGYATNKVSSIRKSEGRSVQLSKHQVLGRLGPGNPRQSPTLSSSILVVIFFLSLQSFPVQRAQFVYQSFTFMRN